LGQQGFNPLLLNSINCELPVYMSKRRVFDVRSSKSH
jgi:hypothetical protein